MKRIYYLLAFIAIAITACNPLDKTYKQIGDLPTPVAPAVTGTSLTLSAADYGLLPNGHAAKKAFYFKLSDTAKVDIPLILASKYPTYGEKSSVSVTYATAPLTIKPLDTVFASVAYTLLPADYTLNGGTTTFTNFSATQIITWLGIKYPTATEGKLAVITFNFFDQGATTNAVQQSFLFTGGAWIKLYHVSPAQYASVGRGGNNNDFVTADAAALPGYFNAFLKADPSVSVTAKAGDIKYVSFKNFQAAVTSGTPPVTVPAVTSQRIMILTFDGTNWTTTSTPVSLMFAKTNGIWVADNTVNYTLVKKDYTDISNIPDVGSAAAIANLASFGNFNIQGGATTWTDAQINNGIATILKTKYPSAVVNQKFNITYSAFNGANIVVTKTFVYNGTAFVYTP